MGSKQKKKKRTNKQIIAQIYLDFWLNRTNHLKFETFVIRSTVQRSRKPQSKLPVQMPQSRIRWIFFSSFLIQIDENKQPHSFIMNSKPIYPWPTIFSLCFFFLSSNNKTRIVNASIRANQRKFLLDEVYANLVASIFCCCLLFIFNVQMIVSIMIPILPGHATPKRAPFRMG